MPPTPPSSAGSDSDGSQSPQRSAPNSPQRQSPVRLYHYHHLHHASSPDTSTCAAQTLSQPLFLSPVSQSCGRQGGTGGLEVVGPGPGGCYLMGCSWWLFLWVWYLIFLNFFFFTVEVQMWVAGSGFNHELPPEAEAMINTGDLHYTCIVMSLRCFTGYI